MAYQGKITRSLAGVLHETYALPERMVDAMVAPPPPRCLGIMVRIPILLKFFYCNDKTIPKMEQGRRRG